MANPSLGPLVDNGGPTRIRALLAGSGAIDLVAAGLCAPIDQQGVGRPQGAACDAGAYEVAPPGVTTGGASELKKAPKRGGAGKSARRGKKPKKFGAARFKIRAGTGAKVKVKLSREGRSLVVSAGKRGLLKAIATAIAFDDAHNSAKASVKLTIKSPTGG